MKLIGLTGGIATGKTMITDYLESLGAPIIDADVISRKLTEAGNPVLDEIASVFGAECLDENGALRRSVLGSIIFNDEEARQKLNNIMHPKIGARVRDEIERLRLSGVKAAIYSAPLLFEAGQQWMADEIWVIALLPDEQIRRLMLRDGVSENEARSRIHAQSSLAEKLVMAHRIIDNNGAPEAALTQVKEYWEQVN